jgi:acyl-coenzyme A synthetase/AMP-(fatty) acid ligase
MFLEGDAVVSLLTGPDTARKIISFVPERSDEDDLQKEILDHCRRKLPWYMVPERIIFVEDFPLNKNGKIDRVKLAELSNERN